MTSIVQAKTFAEAHFPEGPERLAEKLGIKIHHGNLVGCDGWALSGPAGKLIRINSSVSTTRQRFTLAHELGHLLLAVPTVVGESLYDSLKSDSDEERRVNDLASELLFARERGTSICPVSTNSSVSTEKTCSESQSVATVGCNSSSQPC